MTTPDVAESPWKIVATREIVAKLSDKGFIISTLLSLVLIAGLIGFQLWFMGEGEKYTIAVTDEAGERVVAAASEVVNAIPDNNDTVTAVRVADREAGLVAIASDEARAFLEQGTDGWTLTYQKDPSRSLDAYLGEAVRTSTITDNAAEAGVDLADLTRGTSVTTAVVEGDADRAQVAFAVSMVFAILFFMSVITFGMQIAQSVVEEKQSRIVEILASAIPIPHLLAGKVLGNTAMALGQMVLYTGTGLIGLSFTDFRSMVPSLSGAIGWFIAFFLAGFLALACVWAVAGSLASRSEDLQQTTMPLTLLLTPAYIAAFVASGGTKVALSYVPVVSAMVMPARMFEGTAQWWEAVIALTLNLAFAVVTIWFGARLYRASLLQVRGRMKLLDAYRAG